MPLRSLAAEQGLQRGLALGERQRRQVRAVEMHEIEHVIDEALALAGLQRILQRRKNC